MVRALTTLAGGRLQGVHAMSPSGGGTAAAPRVGAVGAPNRGGSIRIGHVESGSDPHAPLLRAADAHGAPGRAARGTAVLQMAALGRSISISVARHGRDATRAPAWVRGRPAEPASAPVQATPTPTPCSPTACRRPTSCGWPAGDRGRCWPATAPQRPMSSPRAAYARQSPGDRLWNRRHIDSL